MERQYRIAIVFGSWMMLIGVAIAIVVPMVGGSMMLSGLTLNDGNALASLTADVESLWRWSMSIGLGMALVGGLWSAIALSRWFLARAETSAPSD